MRRFRIASWILLLLSIIDFTLSVPVAVRDRDKHGVRINVVDVADRTAALQKRMDPERQPKENGPSGQPGPPGPESEPEPESESESQNWNQESDSESKSDSESESEPSSDDSDGGAAAAQWEEEFQNYVPSDIEDQNTSEEDHHDSSDEQSPPNSPEPPPPPQQHPASYEDLGSKILKDLRPRTSTSAAVDVPIAKEGVTGNR